MIVFGSGICYNFNRGERMKERKWFWIVAAIVLGFTVLAMIIVLGINAHVLRSTRDLILSPEETAQMDADCILVLGCRVYEGGTPSHMLEDRLLQAMELFELGAAPKLLMSGDHGQQEYDEVNTMKQFAVEWGAASCDVFMDHAGFSTYESLYRAKEIFGVQKVIIVTQEYHLHRALYIAKELGIEAYGVASDPRSYAGQIMRDVREILARNKDFLNTIFWPEPAYMGASIPISGDGDCTNG